MIKKLTNILAIIALAACATSCLEDGDSTQSYSDAVVALGSNGTELVTVTGNVALEINVNQGTASISFPVPNGSSSSMATFKDLKLSVDSEGYVVNASSATSTTGITAKNFKAKFQFGTTSISNILITFTKDDNTTFVATRQTIAHYSSTTTTTSPSGGSYTCSEAIYNIVLNTEGKTADIVINNIQFVQQAPTLSEITIPGVPYTKVEGGYMLAADEIIPTSAGVPMEARKVSNLNISVAASQGTMSGSFNCMGMECECNAKITYTTNQQ